MRSPKKTIPSPNVREETDLLALELQIAKRADKLRKRGGCSRGKDLVLWLQAERDVLKTFKRPGRSMAALPQAHNVGSRETWLVS
ncbi:MAG TPA: hypothetical protein VGF85_08445 [Opitutaceae bacterium]|jgi:hypothetical protein